MFINYELICYSDFNKSPLAQYQMGYSHVSLVALQILLNFIILITFTINKLLRIRNIKIAKLAKKNRAFEQNDLDELIHVEELIDRVQNKIKDSYQEKIK